MYLALYVLSCECNDVKLRAGLYIQPAGSASKLGKLWFVYVAASVIPRVALGGLYHVLWDMHSSVEITESGNCDPILWHTFNSKAFVLAPSS